MLGKLLLDSLITVLDVGSWEILESSGRYQPAKSMYVWDGCSDAKISFGQVRYGR